jgi:hypothetical protein
MTVRGRVLGGLVLASLVLTGCRIDVGTDVAFDRTGGGEVAVSVRIDGATLRQLDAAGVDPQLDVALGLGPDPSWRAQRVIDADGGLVLTYRRTFADGAGATALLRELSADVAAQDPALRLDVTVVTTPTGGVRMAGTGMLAPPATLGVSLDDEPVGPVGDELAALTARAVRAQLVVRVPGRIVEHDADAVDGQTLRWSIPVGEQRTVVLVSEGLPWWRRVPPWGIGALVTLAATFVLGVRRLRSRAGQRSGEGAGDVSRAG